MSGGQRLRNVALLALLAVSFGLMFLSQHPCREGGTIPSSRADWADAWMRRWIATHELTQGSVAGQRPPLLGNSAAACQTVRGWRYRHAAGLNADLLCRGILGTQYACIDAGPD